MVLLAVKDDTLEALDLTLQLERQILNRSGDEALGEQAGHSPEARLRPARDRTALHELDLQLRVQCSGYPLQRLQLHILAILGARDH